MERYRTNQRAIRAATYCAAAAIVLAACGGEADERADGSATTVPTSSSAVTTTSPTAGSTTSVGSEPDAADESATESTTVDDAAAVSTEPPATTTSTVAPVTTAPVVTTTIPATTPTTSTGEPVAQRLRDAVEATLALTAFDAVVVAETANDGETESLVGTVSYDYAALIGTVAFEFAESDEIIRVDSDGETFWLRVLAEDAARLPDGATWVMGPAELLLSDSADFNSANALAVVAALRSATEVEALGAGETTDGVPVERFRTTVGYDAAMDADDDFGTVYDSALGGRDDAVMDIEVAIDADGLIREFRADAGSPSDPSITGLYELTVANPGGPIDAPVPPDPSDVATGDIADEVRAQYFS